MSQIIDDWEAQGRPIPAPPEYKINTIIEYAKKYDTKIFVETGTNRGNTLGSVHYLFKDNYSVELSNHLFGYCRELFRHYERIHLYQGLSEVEFPKMLSEVKEKAIFWLDSHYSAGETAQGPTNSSLYREIPLILKHSIKDHVILVDDICCCSDSNGYLSYETMEKMILEKYPHYKISVEGYILRAVPYL